MQIHAVVRTAPKLVIVRLCAIRFDTVRNSSELYTENERDTVENCYRSKTNHISNLYELVYYGT